MKICTKCNLEKPETEFYVRSSGTIKNPCKKCHNRRVGTNVSNWRRQVKERLVEHFGSKCLDCSYAGPAFMFDFDHRDPTQKEFGIASGYSIKGYARLLKEAEKCDLVCAMCHRFRTHKQRCAGCQYCKGSCHELGV